VEVVAEEAAWRGLVKVLVAAAEVMPERIPTLSPQEIAIQSWLVSLVPPEPLPEETEETEELVVLP
jgi:hypothetical protein